MLALRDVRSTREPASETRLCRARLLLQFLPTAALCPPQGRLASARASGSWSRDSATSRPAPRPGTRVSGRRSTTVSAARPTGPGRCPSAPHPIGATATRLVCYGSGGCWRRSGMLTGMHRTALAVVPPDERAVALVHLRDSGVPEIEQVLAAFDAVVAERE